MPENHIFEYAIIRIVPKVEREEFFNVGVVLFCKRQDFLEMKYVLHEEKIRLFCEMLHTEELKQYLLSFEKICKGSPEGGPIAALDKASRFRWLTAARSTVLQTSKVHPGLCDDPQKALDHLFHQLVL
ncbi:MAG: DUF3037 domain-containing protein [Chitinophagaceae bacterium]|nr:DUF3037 domain-containing protein [Chitinophagaceae bacterium]MCA6453461.1 DUF3037 domain-containing protein [Chitinophagaceae bacterium]MCA6456595.1 DUF3037 domain-containing protein [Chitinophagaceae bacterium]MCA6460638.1 DUF3037 domain-containing protein [Chitinophagaceae bacterium]MCA6466360.1 DUF3037 domain-containing protein [Chitinophagaceae bacterium]